MTTGWSVSSNMDDDTNHPLTDTWGKTFSILQQCNCLLQQQLGIVVYSSLVCVCCCERKRLLDQSPAAARWKAKTKSFPLPSSFRLSLEFLVLVSDRGSNPHPPSNERGKEKEKDAAWRFDTSSMLCPREECSSHNFVFLFSLSLSLPENHRCHFLSFGWSFPHERAPPPALFFSSLRLILNFWDPECCNRRYCAQPMHHAVPTPTPTPLQRLMTKELETSRAREGGVLPVGADYWRFVRLWLSTFRFFGSPSCPINPPTHPHVCLGSLVVLLLLCISLSIRRGEADRSTSSRALKSIYQNGIIKEKRWNSPRANPFWVHWTRPCWLATRHRSMAIWPWRTLVFCGRSAKYCCCCCPSPVQTNTEKKMKWKTLELLI